MPALPASFRLAWAPVPPGAPRRDVAWALLRDLVPGAVLSAACPRCGGDHGPVRVSGVDVEASVAYAGDHAVVAVVARSAASALGIDAELAEDRHRDDVGFDGVLGPGRPADVRAWTRVEAALKADGRGLRVDPALVAVTVHGDGWTAVVPDSGAFFGRDLDGPPGIVVAAAFSLAG